MPLFDQLKQFLSAPVGGQQVRPLSGLGAGFQAPQYVDPNTQASFDALQNQTSNRYQQINEPTSRGKAIGQALLGTLLLGPAGAGMYGNIDRKRKQTQTDKLQAQYLDTLKTFGYTANQLNPVNQSGIDNRFGASTLNNYIDVSRGLNNTGVSENVGANLNAANTFGAAVKQPIDVQQRQGNALQQGNSMLKQDPATLEQVPTISAGVQDAKQSPYSGARFDENIPLSSDMVKALLQGTTDTIKNASGSAAENTRAITQGALNRAEIGTEGTEQSLNRAKVGTEGARQGLYGAEAYRANEQGRYVAPTSQALIGQRNSAAGLNSANAALSGTRAANINAKTPNEVAVLKAREADLRARASKNTNAGNTDKNNAAGKNLDNLIKLGKAKGYIIKKTGALKPPVSTVGGFMGFGAAPNPQVQEFNQYAQALDQAAQEAIPQMKLLAPLPAQPKFTTGASYAQSVLGGR
jgi:hypothetical protein